ncbi:alanine racemase [Moraxella nasovis]|uniref:alanine racemase n=1 Tax=Moraxella nasovis TaxID=2904121 RepID=UPI001F615CC8|nr:alanine racemase [Moraxella nasovis]UNU73159.1 alanine racemase [Moraxella nasovis]
MRYAQFTISKNALAHNLGVIHANLSPIAKPKVLAMVKADGYGHGIMNVIEGLAAADGFGVACMAEALALKDACDRYDIIKPIVLIEGVFSEAEWQLALSHHFMAVVHNATQLNFALDAAPQSGSPTCTIWLKYNTGMNRLGFQAADIPKAAQQLHDKGYQLILTSHFACADENVIMNDQQITRFNTMLAKLQQTICLSIQGSLCNSAGIFRFPHAHHHWVRTGIALYGSTPLADSTAQALGLKTVMTFEAAIMAIHHLQIGESVSYGAIWTAQKPSRIGIISAGYGDGYPRVVTNATVVIHHGNKQYRTALIGRVAMDMMAIDLSDLSDEINVGAKVTLWGDASDKLPSVDDVALSAGTIGYEVLCRTTHRPTRILTP